MASACGLVAAGVAQAHPPAPIDARGKPVHGKFHRWLHRTEAPLFRGRLQIVRTACPGFPQYVGCVLSQRPRRVYVRPGARRVRAVFYHEVGHVFDLLVLNRSERRQFKRIMGIRAAGWFRGSPGPSEFFADGYTACSFHRRLTRTLSRTAYGYRASPRRHARVCALIRRAAAPRGRRPQAPPNPPPVIDQKAPPAPPRQPTANQPAPEPCGLLEKLLGGCWAPRRSDLRAEGLDRAPRGGVHDLLRGLQAALASGPLRGPRDVASVAAADELTRLVGALP